jgi:hypothetical protein
MRVAVLTLDGTEFLVDPGSVGHLTEEAERIAREGAWNRHEDGRLDYYPPHRIARVSIIPSE